MPGVFFFLYLLGFVLGIVILYFVIKAAVKNAIIEAGKAQKTTIANISNVAPPVQAINAPPNPQVSPGNKLFPESSTWKPGTWECGKCQTVNAPSNTACSKCGNPK